MSENSHARYLRLAAKDIADAGHNGWGNTCKWAADEIDRLERELASRATVREGYVLVPREPTVAMLVAGALKAIEQPSVAHIRLAREAAREVLKGDVMDGMNRAASAEEITGILATMPQYYRAMLSASPVSPPAEPVGGGTI